MLIANPMYDVVFKRLMENEVVARFLISTLLDEPVVHVAVHPQEFTYTDDLVGLALFRLDFLATIQTPDGGYRKVLIEIQKAKNLIDVVRFRNYLAEQYKKKDRVGEREVSLPITTIYILGFTLPEVESPCIRVARTYVDLVSQTPLTTKSEFIEKLTHDCYVVQVERIGTRYQTQLDKLLSIFEQRNFVDDTEITKTYPYAPDLEAVQVMTEILHYVGTEPEERRRIEIEQEAWRTVTDMVEEYQHRLAITQQALAEKDQALAEKEQALTESQQEIQAKDQALVEKDQALANKDQALSEKDRALAEKDRLIEELLRKLNQQP